MEVVSESALASRHNHGTISSRIRDLLTLFGRVSQGEDGRTAIPTPRGRDNVTCVDPPITPLGELDTHRLPLAAP